MQSSLIMTVLLLLLPLWICRSSAAGTIIISPTSQFYGGDKTKPTITCQPSKSCDSTAKWFFGQTQVDTTQSKYTASVNLANHYLTLTINNADEDDEGFYHCQCTFDGTAVNSQNAQITHKNKVSFDTEDNIKYEHFVGTSVTLMCKIMYQLEFEWQFQNQNVIPSNSGKYQYDGNNLIIKNLTLSDSATYYCVGNNEVTTINKLGAVLEVYKRPSVTANNLTTVTKKEGEAVTFSCTVCGHPLPSIVWSKVGTTLKIEGRVSKSIVTLDKYTRWSSLIVTHLSTADSGQYLCTGHNVNASSAESFTLSVEVPPEPFFDVFSISKSHDSINISWILSGVSSELINVTWNTAEGDQYQLHWKNASSVTILDLLPETLYLISAQVVGTELSDSVNESTDPIATVVTPSVSLNEITSTSLASSVSSSVPRMSLHRPIITSSTAMSPKRPTVSSVNKHRETSSFPLRPEPSVGGSQAVSNSLITVVPITVSLLLMFLIGTVVITVACFIRRGRQSKTRNLQSIERATSSRSSQVLLDNGGNGFLGPSGTSFVSTQSGLYHSNPSLTTAYVQSFNDIEKLPPESSCGHLSNNSSHIRLPPPPYGTENFYIIDGGEDEPFEMTDNPGNFDNETEQLATPQMSQNHFFDDGHGFPVGDSVSQVLAPVFTSQSQTFPEICTSQNEVFVYMDNKFYEPVPMKRDTKSQSEPPRSSNNQPMYENHSTKQPESPKFGIVRGGRRGDIREQVEIKK